MRIDSGFDDARGELALELLQAGKEIKIGRLGLHLSSTDDLTLRIESKWGPEHVNEKIARQEFDFAQASFGKIREEWPGLARMITPEPAKMELVHNYGMGSVVLCELSPDGEITWRDRTSMPVD